MHKLIQVVFSAFILLLVFTHNPLLAQIEEPDILDTFQPRTPSDDGVKSGLGFNVVINNFGFGIGGEYRRVLSDFTYGTANVRMTGLRDVSEQTFTDFFFGQQVIPNKYQRAFSFPVTLGIKQRVFPNKIADNFRFYLSAGLGPVFAFSYPYFDDLNENGYREQFRDPSSGQFYVEQVNDIFTGLGEGDWHVGLVGEFKISMDIGENFARMTTIEFGYMMYYFDSGIQVMQPNQPAFTAPDFQGPDPTFIDIINGDYEMRSFFDAQRFFGTPQISLKFGRMW